MDNKIDFFKEAEIFKSSFNILEKLLKDRCKERNIPNAEN